MGPRSARGSALGFAGNAIRWDVVEEHLDEAAFLHAQWEQALDHPEYRLEQVFEGPETRMLAHVDGLVLHGRRAAERLLVPALAGEERDLVFPAALALLGSEEGDFTQVVLERFEKAEPERAGEVVRALEIGLAPEAAPRVMSLLAGGSATARAAALDLTAFRRLPPCPLEPFLAGPDPELRRAALRVARVFPDGIDPQRVEQLLKSTDDGERSLAIEVGLTLGLRAAWTACEEAVRSDRAEGWETSALLHALSGEPDLAPLLDGLEDARRRKAALFALGFTGRAAAAEAALPWLADGGTAGIAGETFSAITGLAMVGEFVRPAQSGESARPEEEGDAPYAPESDFPRPEPEAVAAWWRKEKGKLDPAGRYLGGRPWSVERVLEKLVEGPTRRRRALALDLAVRTGAACRLETRDLASRQRSELAETKRAMPSASRGTYREMTDGQRRPERSWNGAGRGNGMGAAPTRMREER